MAALSRGVITAAAARISNIACHRVNALPSNSNSRAAPRPHSRTQRRVAVASAAVPDLTSVVEALVEDLEPEFEESDDGVGLSTQQVESFLRTLCEETDIVDVQLEMGDFSLKVRRSMTGGVGNDSAPVSHPASPVATQSFDFLPTLPVMSRSADSSMGQTMTQSTMSYDDEDSSESMVFVTAPKVGTLRLGKYVKGKRIGKGNIVSEGDQVKKGQHVGYVEQLGTFAPIEAPQAGELVAFVAEEGQPVEYGETVVELAPFFGGHIIGDRKYF